MTILATLPTSDANPNANPKPTILLLSLDHKPFFDTVHSRLIAAMASKATIKRATQPAPALDFLATHTPQAIFITDPGLLAAAHAAVLARVVAYVRGGGTAVVGGLFASFVRPLDMAAWFRSGGWDLPWEAGDYHRTTVELNAGAARVLGRHALLQEYSQKAVFLRNVAAEAAWYLPSERSRTESFVFEAEAVDGRQTPVAMAAVGEGWLGYVGDVNAEVGSDGVVLAMCGLVD